MSEYEHEPIPGLPGIPPSGELILWQGSPDWRALARSAFHTRLVTIYFALLTGWALVDTAAAAFGSASHLSGVAMTIFVGAIGVGLLHLLAWGSARSTIYTLTDRRVVLRIGMAVPKCINLPFGQIASVDLSARADGSGDLPLTLTGEPKLGYLALWPHARPWKVARPQPMLRAVPDAATIGAMIARHCLGAHPSGQLTPIEAAAEPLPAYAEAATA